MTQNLEVSQKNAAPASLLDKLYASAPGVHRGETEMVRPPERTSSGLDDEMWASISHQACYGVGRDVAEFLFTTIRPGWKTLETGSGLSTMLFAARGAHHTAVTPNVDEEGVLRRWANEQDIDFSQITFVALKSEEYLPTCPLQDLDFVLIDGKHAFPWPIVDWFFTAERLKQGGLLLLDDADLAPVEMLAKFLEEDTRWKLQRRFARSVCFVKTENVIHDVSWHMQPYVAKRFLRPKPNLGQRLAGGIRRRISPLLHN